MKSIFFSLVPVLFTVLTPLLRAEVNGPDFIPPFEVKEAVRQNPKLEVKSFIDSKTKRSIVSPSLQVGNKSLTVREFDSNRMTGDRDYAISLFLNKRYAFSFLFAGSYRNSDGKWVNFTQNYQLDKVKLVYDKSSGTIQWNNPYPLPDGRIAEFSYRLKSLGNSRIELSWDIGCSEKESADFKAKGALIQGCILYFDIPDYRRQTLQINGSPLSYTAESVLKSKDGNRIRIWNGILKRLEFNPASRENGFSITSDSNLRGSATETYAWKRTSLSFMLNNGAPRGSLVIDFGAAAVSKSGLPPPVEGNDLWAQDALHLPLSPTRNLFPNPSFEQGFRYWRWQEGGAQYSRSPVKRYAIDSVVAKFGKNSFVFNPAQYGVSAPMSFSLPGRKGQVYTISFYAKGEKNGASIRFALSSRKQGGQFPRSYTERCKPYPLTTEWKRFSTTFTSDGSPVAVVIGANGLGGKVWLDGIQYERGNKASEFVSSPLEGLLRTSHPDNNIEFGTPIRAKFDLFGKEGTSGSAEFTLMDFYKKVLWKKTLPVQAGKSVELPFDSLGLAPGPGLLQVRYVVPGTKPYYDFYRFSLIRSLNGSHATKDLYGALFATAMFRTEERLDLMQRFGFGGSASYGDGWIRNPLAYELRKKYHVTDYTHCVNAVLSMSSKNWNQRTKNPDYRLMMQLDSRIWRTPEQAKEVGPIIETYSDEIVKHVEDLAYRSAKEHPYVRVWSFATEEEILMPCIVKRRDYTEFAKLQRAVYRGVKRGNPKALVMPSGGTSGYGKIRGKDAVEGYLKATPDIKWDAIAIHPYGAVDGTQGNEDLDEAIQQLITSVAKYGYGPETPLLLNEGGGGGPCLWGDGPDYTYSGGQPSYDQGLHEFLHASLLARQYIICLKYWPRIPHYNTWQSDHRTLLDLNLTPSTFLFGINTLGHLLAKPEFIADIRPASGMRGYAFRDDRGNGVAALWCTNDDVERGVIRGPVMRVKFGGELPELFDLAGKQYPVKSGPDGWTEFRLTPAPLFLRSRNPERLVSALKEAEVLGAGASVQVSFKPDLSGKISAAVTNLTGRTQSGRLFLGSVAHPFRVDGNRVQMISLSSSVQPRFGEMFRKAFSYRLVQDGAAETAGEWNMDYFYVPKVEGAPDWTKIPGIRMTNLYHPEINLKRTPGGHPGDLSALFKAAWDKENFYLRVEAEDDIFRVDDPAFWSSEEAKSRHLYRLDGCLEVYFDCGANGRLRKGGFDLDDYRYDFCAGNREGKSGPGLVCRFREVFQEYAGGPNMPSRKEAAEKIRCDFQRVSKTKYIYTITFPQRYLEPMRLQKGTVAGFGLYLHDRMDDGTMGNKGMSLATAPGAHCDASPHLWPLMILTE